MAAAHSRRRLLVGPWLSEVGFEVLYWVPMLQWLTRHGTVDPANLVAVTRGGAHVWYQDVCGDHVELFDLMTPEQLKDGNTERVAREGGQKHMAVTDLDRHVLSLVRDRLGTDVELLHPSLMYNAFRYFWNWQAAPKTVLRYLHFAPLPDPSTGVTIPPELPDEYVAVKAYFSSCFPPTEANRAFVRNLVARLAAQTTVVLLSTGIEFDDHSDVEGAHGDRVIDARRWMRPQDNLAVQSQIIQGATALLSTYGGFSYIGPFFGVPSVCFFSDENFNAMHLQLMRRASDALGGHRFIALDTRDLPVLDRLLGASQEGALGIR